MIVIIEEEERDSCFGRAGLVRGAVEKDAMEMRHHESHRSVASTIFQSSEKQCFLGAVIDRLFHSCLLTMLPTEHGHSTCHALGVAQGVLG